MRSAYHKEVIQVKEELVKNMTHKGAMIEDMEEVISRGFDLNLLAEPLGKGPSRFFLKILCVILHLCICVCADVHACLSVEYLFRSGYPHHRLWALVECSCICTIESTRTA
jgi:hypothetical protein